MAYPFFGEGRDHQSPSAVRPGGSPSQLAGTIHPSALACYRCGVQEFAKGLTSGDSWMYPYQRTPMGNPYISPIYPYIVGVYGLLPPRIPIPEARCKTYIPTWQCRPTGPTLQCRPYLPTFKYRTPQKSYMTFCPPPPKKSYMTFGGLNICLAYIYVAMCK